MDPELAAGDRKLDVGCFEQGHAVRHFARLVSKARCPYSLTAGCISGRMHLERRSERRTSARRPTAKRHHATSTYWLWAFLNCALGVQSQMSVQPRSRMHLGPDAARAQRAD
jgi:hypothetical protein